MNSEKVPQALLRSLRGDPSSDTQHPGKQLGIIACLELSAGKNGETGESLGLAGHQFRKKPL